MCRGSPRNWSPHDQLPPAPKPTPIPATAATPATATADPTTDPTEQPSPSPTPSEQESDAFVSVDPAHADYFEQVIAMTNRNHLIALDGLTGAEVEQPISVWAQHPMRPARSYVWVAGERGDTVYAVVLGGLGEGWVLTSLPQ